MKRNLVYGLTMCIVGLAFMGCETSAIKTTTEAVSASEYNGVVDDKFNFSTEDIKYIFDLTKEELISKFGKNEFEADGITAKDVESKIYGFNNNDIMVAISNDTQKVVVLNSTDDSIEHIKGIKIGDSLDVAISKLSDDSDFDLNSAIKTLEWDGGYNSWSKIV